MPERPSGSDKADRLSSTAPRAAFRRLRVLSSGRWRPPAELEKPILEESARLIAITSALPGQGKSVVASNLAAAIAGLGREVLLVDLDGRTPRQHALLGLPAPAAGMAAWLDARRERTDGAHTVTKVRNLRLLPCLVTGQPSGDERASRLALVRELHHGDGDVIVVDIGTENQADLFDGFASGAHRVLVTGPGPGGARGDLRVAGDGGRTRRASSRPQRPGGARPIPRGADRKPRRLRGGDRDPARLRAPRAGAAESAPAGHGLLRGQHPDSRIDRRPTAAGDATWRRALSLWPASRCPSGGGAQAGRLPRGDGRPAVQDLDAAWEVAQEAMLDLTDRDGMDAAATYRRAASIKHLARRPRGRLELVEHAIRIHRSAPPSVEYVRALHEHDSLLFALGRYDDAACRRPEPWTSARIWTHRWSTGACSSSSPTTTSTGAI